MSVVKALANVAKLFRVQPIKEKPVVDNVVFRLHYKLTCAFFLAACMLISTVELFGKPIQCMTDNAEFKHIDVVNTYCWINHTFTVLTKQQPMAHPGVGPERNYEKRLHSYYQWVPFVLFLQAVLFYMPHWIWKNCEGGLVKQLTEGQRGLILEERKETRTLVDEDKMPELSVLTNYLYETLGTRYRYGVLHVICELLNLVNAVANIYLIDLFLGGVFFQYGWSIFALNEIDQDRRVDSLIDIFPRVTKCTFRMYGSSGTIQNLDALCVLPLNVINEKIYIFAWFWLILLSLITLLAVVYRIVLMASPAVRRLVLRRLIPTAGVNEVNILSRRLSYSDSHLLLLLAKNMKGHTITNLIDELARVVDN